MRLRKRQTQTDNGRDRSKDTLKTIIDQPFGHGLCNLFMVIRGETETVYCLDHIKTNIIKLRQILPSGNLT